MAQDAATAVLRDFEILTWLTLIFGLLGCAVWSFFSSRRREASGGAAARSREYGVPTDHFSGADLVVLPMVLVKFSFALIMVATFLFSLPQRFILWLGVSPGENSGELAPESDPDSSLEMTPELFGADLMLNLLLVSLVMVMIQWVGRSDPSEVFGLRRLKWWKLPLWIGAGAVVAIPAVQTIVLVSHYGLQSLFGEGLEDQVAVQSLREADEDPMMRILLIFNACVVAPIVEEVVFRGYLYGVLKRFTGAMFAAFVGASLFAVAHNNLPAVMPLWGFALILTFSYEASRSLWVPIGIHAAFNAYQVYRLLDVSGG